MEIKHFLRALCIGDIMLVPLWGAPNVIYTWMKKHCCLKGINLERWGFKDSYSFKANSKVFQQKFTLSQAAQLVWMQIPRVSCLRNAVVFLCLPRKLSGPILWFSSVKIPDLPCTGEVVGLSARKLGTIRPFLEYIVVKSIDNVNFSGKNCKFAMLIRFYP